MNEELEQLDIWTRRRSGLLTLMLVSQLLVAFFFQDFRATMNVPASGSAFAVSGAGPIGTPSAFAAAGAAPAGAPQFTPVLRRTTTAPTIASLPGSQSGVPVADLTAQTGPTTEPGAGTGLPTISPAAAPASTLVQTVPSTFSDLPLPSSPGSSPTQVSPAPEPSSWAMMILGFGLIGLMLRRQRAADGRLVARLA